ncbi:MAG TPA: type II secretion system F family protein [Streptosporangiaceae bacterium]|nr:type II secretion system F family protein [Streptosporangiaceae bacterium]
MNLWVIAAGILVGLGVFVAVRELVPAPSRLEAALARLDPGAAVESGSAAGRGAAPAGKLAQRIAAELHWLPVPTADLALLGKNREGWIASKVGCGLLGLAFPPLLVALASLAGTGLPWTVPTVFSLLCGTGLFFAPDLVTRVNAAERRTDFRRALTSYLDLVALERGAGAGPTEALEAAAEIGEGWAFGRISAALDAARRAGAAPWTALARLARETGISELADVADIAEVAGQEGAKILDTLAARAASMRAEALAADRATAGSRSTTMVIPIALLGAGFLLLLIFPIVYRTFGPG